jgi:hypothetical protein
MDFGMIGCVRLKFLGPRNWRLERVALSPAPQALKRGWSGSLRIIGQADEE